MQRGLPKTGNKDALAERLRAALQQPASAAVAPQLPPGLWVGAKPPVEAAEPGIVAAAEPAMEPAAVERPAAPPPPPQQLVSQDADDDGIVRSGRRNSRRARYCSIGCFIYCCCLLCPSMPGSDWRQGSFHAVRKVAVRLATTSDTHTSARHWMRCSRRAAEVGEEVDVGPTAAAAMPAVPPTGRGSVITPEESVDDMEMVGTEDTKSVLIGMPGVLAALNHPNRSVNSSFRLVDIRLGGASGTRLETSVD